MSQWARENPDAYSEIAALPPSQQNAALRHAMGYDPDRVRDEAREREMWGPDPLDEEAEIAELERLAELGWGPDAP